MSLINSLSSGTSGLASASKELAVVSDNLANSSTIGFKSSRAVFEETLSQSIVGGVGDVGLGSRVQAVQRMITQGAITNTGVTTDLALEGAGFFVVRGTVSGRAGNYFTRAGQFTVDRDGYLVNLQGLRVQGFNADAMGTVTSAFGDLVVGTALSQPRPTSTLTVRMNLSSDATAPANFSLANPSGTSNASTSVTVYDSIGAPHQVQVYFRRQPTGDWEWHATSDGGGITGGAAGTPEEIASGTLAFDTSGRLQSMTQSSDFNPLNADNPQALSFNFGDPLDPPTNGTGLLGITQFSAPSSTSFVGQDGWASGELAQVQIDKDGSINGVFTNGQSRTIGQVAVAAFGAADRLERMGGNVYAQTRASGEPSVGVAGEGGRGTIAAGALEQSNVDIGEQFVRMISAQRAFEANSKSITTADQLLSELIQMKR
jgi:flagellar hook protein FlgE